MRQEPLYDITKVCEMLNTTSRTLRFYEEKGLIQSSTVGTSSRRQYTAAQIAHIKNVFILRTLGLSIRSISALLKQDIDLRDAILQQRAEIYALIDTRMREISLLNEALSVIDAGKDIFAEKQTHVPSMEENREEIVKICANAIVYGQSDVLYPYLSPLLIRYMPKNVYEEKRKDTLAVLGELIAFENTVVDPKYPNRISQFIKYTKLGLKLTFVFHDQKIDGLWMGYYPIRERSAHENE